MKVNRQANTILLLTFIQIQNKHWRSLRDIPGYDGWVDRCWASGAEWMVLIGWLSRRCRVNDWVNDWVNDTECSWVIAEWMVLSRRCRVNDVERMTEWCWVTERKTKKKLTALCTDQGLKCKCGVRPTKLKNRERVGSLTNEGPEYLSYILLLHIYYASSNHSGGDL